MKNFENIENSVFYRVEFRILLNFQFFNELSRNYEERNVFDVFKVYHNENGIQGKYKNWLKFVFHTKMFGKPQKVMLKFLKKIIFPISWKVW